MRVVAIVNQKGGCGKTTCAINLAAVLAARGKRVLLVDMDPQSHCAAGLGVPEERIDRHVGDLLVSEALSGSGSGSASGSGGLPPKSTYRWEVARNLDLIPSTMALAGLEAPGGGLHRLPDKDRRLSLLLSRMRGSYDVAIVDCPPTIGLLTFNALRAADEALIPVETGFFALRGARKQWVTIRKMVERVGHPVGCWVLPTLHRREARLSEAVLNGLERYFAGRVVPVVIREDEALREAASFGQPVTEYEPDSDAALDFEALADWWEEDRSRPLLEVETTGRTAREEEGASAGGRAAELARRVRECHGGGGAGGAGRGGHGGSGCGCEEPRDEVRGSVVTILPPERSEARVPRHLLGARETGSGVLFVQPGGPEERLAIAGDFNRWSDHATPLRYNEELGVHEGLVALPPGRHEYRLVVNGEWRLDPHNEFRCRNEYGEDNNVILVRGGDHGARRD